MNNTRDGNIKKNKDHQAIETIKTKWIKNKAIITKADKGNSLIIMNKNVYNEETHEFFNNSIHKLNKVPTNNFHTTINTKINQSKLLLNITEKKKTKLIKPTAPKLQALPKIHKHDIPIRPIVKSQMHQLIKFLNIYKLCIYRFT